VKTKGAEAAACGNDNDASAFATSNDGVVKAPQMQLAAAERLRLVFASHTLAAVTTTTCDCAILLLVLDVAQLSITPYDS